MYVLPGDRTRRALLAAFTVLCFSSYGGGHIWWSLTPGPKAKRLRHITFLYGEIQVLASGPTIYYCGVNWQPGRPGGSYCGIQEHGDHHKCTIFSVWDTSPTLHPGVVEADHLAKYSRFGGEGTGAHTHLNCEWRIGQVFRYAVTKQQDKTGANTLTRYYFFDRTRKTGKEKSGAWVLEATVSSPTDGKDSVRYFGGGMNSFLENWSGRNREVPKLCLYRLWAGTSPEDLRYLRQASGDGVWGILNDSYFLGEGKPAGFLAVFRKAMAVSEYAVYSPGRGAKSAPISERTIPADVLDGLKHLPRHAPSVQ